MPYVKGTSGNKKGREMGRLNRLKYDVFSICEHSDANPVKKIIEIMKETDDVELKLRCAEILLPYCASKLKSVEISSAQGSEFHLNIIQSTLEK